MKPSEELFLEQTQSRRFGVDVKEVTRWPRGRKARPGGQARPPPLWAPRDFTDLVSSPIYSHIPQNQQREPQKHFSTATTFCTREIPSRGPFPAIYRRGNQSRGASTSTPLPLR